MDDTVLDIDQIENLIKFSPTKEEMETLKVPCLFLVSSSGTLCQVEHQRIWYNLFLFEL